ncbi:hypothetical protein [Mycoplasma wenyonii]|uniref:hypothetical protein n=1 Tax=Mycoplasma wenyonii TaxID=65123 RepID=UPI0011BD1472|nr:hypothetical protein [Mycoplasma wenyonii]
MSLKCRQGANSVASSGDDYTLKWSGDLEGEKLNELMSDGEVNVDGELELKAGGDWGAINKFTTGEEDAFLTAYKIENNKGLHISLMDPNDRGADRSRHAVNFWCGLEESQVEGLERDPSGGFVWTTSMTMRSNTTLVSDGDESISVEISLKKCNFDGDGKTVTCDLKLTTGSDLKIKNKQLNQMCLPYYSLVF